MSSLFRLLPLLLLASAPALAQRTSADTGTSREAQVAARFATAWHGAALRMLLQAMPKGGDLHNHLSGTVYAEDYLRWAAEEDYCVDTRQPALRAPPCGDGQVPARGLAERDAALYARMVDAMSMRNFVPGQPEASGHDRFFASFGKFGVDGRRRTESLIAVLEQAARDNVQYVEVMADPEQTMLAGRRMHELAWTPDDHDANLRRIAAYLPGWVRDAKASFAATDAQARKAMRCGQRDASPGCEVEYRYLTYVLRTLPPAVVFGQMALHHALVADGGSRFVGVNIVAPEDHPVALADYRTHMAMFRFFATRYPDVPLSLHAGELTLGLVPPAELRFHIRDAVDAGARRIGHGVDIAYEDNAPTLLRDMRRRDVAVEINLSSNAGILGVSGIDHPLPLYLQAGVPVVLSTDDAGVSRGDLTHEYQRAVREQGLDYHQLKRIARNGIGYGFLPGERLWQADGRANPACASTLAGDVTVDAKPDRSCRALLARSDKARQQWRLEQQFARFEADTLADIATR